jgi:hypothetical protein
MIIPPKLKILAGFKPDEDVTIDQILAALEGQNLRQKPTATSEKPDMANHAAVRERQAQFQSLMNTREQEFSGESFEERFDAVMSSEKGQQLLAQMERPETLDENLGNQQSDASSKSTEPAGEKYDPELHQKSRQEFQDLVERLKLDGTGRDQTERWMHASSVHPIGRKLYSTWQKQALLQKREEMIAAQRARGGTGGIGLATR